MFKLDHKLLLSATTIATIFTTSSFASSDIVRKPDISGGVQYPIVGNKTHIYRVNPNAYGLKLNYGRAVTKNELKAWDKDVMPDGTGLPEGSGSVEEGEELYEAQCVMCHGDFGSGGGGYPALAKGNAVELQKTLTNNRWKDPEADGPVRVFGSYWPEASTLYWYIKDAMPHTKSKTLSVNETYALTAYILNINEFEIDGVEVDEEYVLNRAKFLKIKMPNRDGFVPKIKGKNGLKNVRKFYKNPKNFGAIKVTPSKRCMSDCQKKSAKTIYIKNGGIRQFEPPMSIVRDLPKAKTNHSSFDAKKSYKDNCTMCHGSFAPAAGDKTAWSDLLKKGINKVYTNGIKGTKTGMPAKGGASLSDAEFKKVVDFMVNFK
jgi:cytochrome c